MKQITTTTSNTAVTDGGNYKHVSIYQQVKQRFRVTIYRDSFLFQSHAKVELWTPNGWALVHDLGQDELVDLPAPARRSVADRMAAITDITNRLLDTAIEVTR